MKGVTVCLDNVSFVLCPPFIIKEKEMASAKALIKISDSSKEKQILLLIYPWFAVSVKSFVIVNKFAVYVKLWKPYKGLCANKIYLYFLTSSL